MKTTRLMKALTSVLVFLSMFSADAEKITSEPLVPSDVVTVTGVATAGTYTAEITMDGLYQLTSAGLPDWVESVELDVGNSHYTLDSSVRYLIVMPISGTGTIALTMKQNFGETRSADWTIAGDGDTPGIEVQIVQSGDDDPGDWPLTVETNGYTWTYSVVDGGAVIGVTDRYGSPKRQRAIEPAPTGALVIPPVLAGYPVTGIGSCAFLGCGQMTSVTIPAGVTQIGSEAFRSCERLETVVYEGDEATVALGSGVFFGTPYNANRPFRLLTDGTTVTGFDGVPPKDLVIPDGVTKIGTNAFGLEDNIFQFDSVVIADSVVSIGGGAFAGCEIKNLKLGKGITDIRGLKGWFALSPTGAKFPNGGDSFDTATRLAGEAGEATGRYYPGVSSSANNVIWLWVAPESGSVEFRTAASAGRVDTTLALYDSTRRQLAYNDDGAENNCSRISYWVTQGEAYFIGVGRYSGADEFQLSWKYGSGDEPTDVELSFENIDFGDGVGYIPSELFAGCTTLGTVRFGDALYGIGDSAFDGCSSLSNINFTASIEDIGSSAFWGTALSTVDLSACTRLTEISHYAFCVCASLTTVVFPSSMREIGTCAFANCPNLSEIVLNEGLYYIEDHAFGSSSGEKDEEEGMVFNAKLARVNIPSTVNYIDDEIFLGCTNLTEITGGEGLVECGSDPFGWNVPAFPRAEVASDGTPLPFKIHRIGKVVFGFQGICPDRLAAADFGDALTIGGGAFYDEYGPSVTNLVSLVLPDTLENVGWRAFCGASSLADIDFGGNAGQLSIGDSAFKGVGIRELKGEFGRLDWEAFAYCPNLITVDIAADTLYRNAIFAECRALETLKVDTPNVLGGLCRDCPNLVSVAFSERVESIEENAFENCASLKSVVFDGNAPTTSWGMYSGTPDDLTSYVRRGSVGWTGPKAGGLPETWPVGDAYARPIAYREDVPALTYAVTFDLGEHGVRVGGGELTQTVVGGEAAVAPVVSAEDGWEFYGWSADVESICKPTMALALYKRADAWDTGRYSLVTTNGNAVCTWGVSIDGSGATITSVSADVLKGKLQLEIPSEFGGWPVRAIGYGAFQNAYKLTSVVLPRGLERIEERAFNGCNIRLIIIPETVTYIGDYAFGSSLRSIWFEGDCPEAGNSVYSYAYSAWSYVREGKWGWDLSTGRWRERPIKLWTIYPETGYSVTFDLGEHGVRTGCGELDQLVVEGGDAIAPVVQPNEGFTFVGWSWTFTNVTERVTVKALYRDADGRPVDWYDVGGGCVIDLTEYMEEGDWGEIYRYWDVEGDDLVTPYSSELEAGLEFSFPRRGLLTFEYKVESSVPGVYPDWMCGEIYQEDNYLECWFEGASSYEQQGWRTCRFAISEPGRGVAGISAGGCADGTPFRLHLRNFKWQDAPEYVTITLDPQLGKLPDGQSAELQLRTDGTFGELPVPVREGCEFLWWCYEYETTAMDTYDVGPDTPVPLYDMTLTALWDVPPAVAVNPNGDLDDLSFDGDWWVNAYKESGLEIDPVTGEVVITDPVWREYAYYDVWFRTNSTVEAFSATFKGAGILDFSRLDGRISVGGACEEYQSRPFTLLVDGEPVEPFSGLNGSWILVKTTGEHRLSISFENEWGGSADAYLYLGAITLEPAPAEVEVTFDPRGGSAAYTTKTYKTGAAYGELPSVAERPGFEFLGWFTAAQGGHEVVATDLVDFTVTELYAQWRTDLNTALDNKNLAFVSGGQTGWTGQSGVSHDGIAAAASGFLDYNETNTLSTTVSGKGVLSFWWKTDDGDGLAKMGLALTVDGRTTWLGKPYKAGDCWLNFALPLTNDGPHTVTWSSAVDSTDYNELTAWGVEMYTLAETIEMNRSYIDMGLLSLPGAWVDQVVWTPDETVDIVKWGDSSWQAKRFLPGSAEQMIAKCDARIAADASDYEAHVRRAIARLKKLGEDEVFAQLLARYGYEFSGELMAFVGELDFTDAPLSNDAVDTVAAEALPALADILADLETVPQGWTGCVALSPDQYPVDESVYVDYADVTLAKAAVHGAKAAVFAAKGYDLTIDNQKAQAELAETNLTIEAVMAAHPQCAAKIRDQASLTAGKGELRTALELYGAFDVAARSRTTGNLHFFEFDPQDIHKWKAVANAAKTALVALDEVVVVKGEDYACFEKFRWTNMNELVTLKPFFDGKVLRSLLPPFEGNRPVLSSIPDITFAGTFPAWTLENQMYWLSKIDGIWHEMPEPPMVVTNMITYLNLEGAANTNATTFTANDLPLTLGPVERVGYTFLGWTPQGGVIPVGTATNVVFAAQWEQNKYTVRYDGNGNDVKGSMADQEFVFNGESQQLRANAFSRDGYIFLGWSRRSDGTAQFADGARVANLAIEPGETVVLYAVWGLETFTITYDLAGGDNAPGNPTEYTAFDLPITLENPTYAYGEFDRWTPQGGVIPVGTASNVSFTAIWKPLHVNGMVIVGRTLTKWEGGGDLNVVVPEFVTEIADEAFRDCFEIESVTLPDGLRRIGRRAFAGCSGLLDIVIPDSVVEIGDEAFRDCGGLMFVSLPLSLETFGENVFTGCDGISGVQVPTHAAPLDELFPDQYGQIESVSVPQGEQLIMPNMFMGCTSLQTVTWPESVTEVGSWAFAGCTGLVGVNLPDGVVEIGEHAFDGCSNLASITLPQTLETVRSQAFARCRPLLSVTMPENVKTLGSDLFASSSVISVNFLGNAPDADENLYREAATNLTTYVIRGTTGWDGREGSQVLPPTWRGRPTAFLQAEEIEVTFDANGGTPEEQVVGQMPRDTYVLPREVPTRDGYVFAGWWTSRELGGQVKPSTKVTMMRPHRLYAHWKLPEDTVDVYFNANGGNVDPSVRRYGAQPTYGDFPVATRRGYRFLGWYTETEGGELVTEGMAVSFASTTLFAHWTENTYSVVFHSNRVDGRPEETCQQQMRWGEEYALDKNPFTWEGHTFGGWANPDHGDVAYADMARVRDLTEVYGGSVHLYAKWSGATYGVRFDRNGGSGHMDDQVFWVGVQSALAANTYVREGYVFMGWARSEAGANQGNVDYLDRQRIRDGAEIGRDCVLFAVWQPEDVSFVDVYFKYNDGGSGSMREVISSNVQLGELPQPERRDYEFVGWHVETESGEAVSPSTSVRSLFGEPGPRKGAASPKAPLAEEGFSGRRHATLVAEWKYVGKIEGAKVVTFDANGGETSEATREVMPGEAVGAPLPKATHADWTFLGWFTAAEGGDPVAAGTIVTDDVTFFAHWDRSCPIREDDVVGDRVEPTIFANVRLSFGDTPMSVGDVVGMYRTANGQLCGYGVAIESRDAATMTMSVQVTGGTEVYFRGWQKSSGVTTNLLASLDGAEAAQTIRMPAPGSVDAVLALMTDTTKREDDRNVPIPDPAPSADDQKPVETPDAALSYTGYVTNEVAEIVGLVTVKVTKKGAVTATVQVPEGAKLAKYTYKGTLGEELTCSKNGRKMTALVCAGLVRGEIAEIGGYTARTSEKTMLAALDGFVKGGVWTVALKTVCAADTPALMNGYSVFSVTGGSKGKVKVSGYLADGTKVSLTAQGMAFGDSAVVVPVVYQKKTGAFSFKMLLKKDASAEVGNVSDWAAVVNGQPATATWAKAEVSAVGNVAADDRFGLDERDITEAFGKIVPASKEGVSILPDGVRIREVNAANGKWMLPKSGKVTLNKAKTDLDVDKFKAKNETEPNPAALKLTYKPKTGFFTGSFALYQDATKDNKPKLKKLTAKVNGAVVNGKGYGTAVVKKVGSLPVTVGK